MRQTLATSVIVLTGTATAVPLLASGGGRWSEHDHPVHNAGVFDLHGAGGGCTSSGGRVRGVGRGEVSIGTGIGGLGGHVGGLLHVSPNQQLDVCVGEDGVGDGGGTPGFNGGGQPGTTFGSVTSMGKVGGHVLPDVRTGTFTLSDRVPGSRRGGGGGGLGALNGGRAVARRELSSSPQTPCAGGEEANRAVERQVLRQPTPASSVPN